MLSKVDPNQLTTVRLLLTPIALLLLLQASAVSLAICLFVMIVIELTDFFDGYVARKYNKGSDWGKVYDPMCDAVYHLTMYLGLIGFFASKLFVVAVAIIFFREIFVAYLRVFCATNGLVLAAMRIGKFKANMQMISVFSCVIWLFLADVYGDCRLTGAWFWFSVISVALALIFTIISLGYYCSFVKKNFLGKNA